MYVYVCIKMNNTFSSVHNKKYVFCFFLYRLERKEGKINGQARLTVHGDKENNDHVVDDDEEAGGGGGGGDEDACSLFSWADKEVVGVAGVMPGAAAAAAAAAAARICWYC